MEFVSKVHILKIIDHQFWKAHPGFRVVVSCRPLLLYNPLSSAFRHHHLSACSLRIARTRTMVNIRNLIDDVKCFQTVRDLRWP